MKDRSGLHFSRWGIQLCSALKFSLCSQVGKLNFRILFLSKIMSHLWYLHNLCANYKITFSICRNLSNQLTKYLIWKIWRWHWPLFLNNSCHVCALSLSFPYICLTSGVWNSARLTQCSWYQTDFLLSRKDVSPFTRFCGHIRPDTAAGEGLSLPTR